MPHFVIDCSQETLNIQAPETIILEVHKTATASGLFNENDIKVRLNPYKEHYLTGGKPDNFIHVFGDIMQGRTIEQKAALSKSIVDKLKELFPSINFIAMNVRDFEKATYCNKNMI